MTEPYLLSFRQAARLLGVGRNSTLADLIGRGVIPTVLVCGRRYISREALEEFARSGEQPTQAAPGKTPRKRKGGSIADLKIV